MKIAPDFTLKDTHNKDVILSEYIGKKNVVLLFFPLAFSGVCTKELCSTRDNLKIYDSLNTEVFGISIDSFFTLRAFKEANNLNFKLLSDFNKEVSKEYDALYENYYGMKGVSKRSVFVIDKKGRITYQEILEDSDKLPDFNKVQQALADIA
ncbi:MAG: peroxiredoxin [Gracilimonas sp.]|uniref:peroxiredoxin n=1 Tax=Gracilimonas sp. TaxID=1974203 RepID=UPI0019A63A98|nr:peroxiredoxin [Gracilimonas sp.]MBD3615756.1 peroxiredoxin [Gracilimonas sp.]